MAGVFKRRRWTGRDRSGADSGGNIAPLICSEYCVYRVKNVDNT